MCCACQLSDVCPCPDRDADRPIEELRLAMPSGLPFRNTLVDAPPIERLEFLLKMSMDNLLQYCASLTCA
jgi:hypothetical protein